ncbi:hypothetical protein GR235_14505 [Rhizobium leguminosarum]|jgi:peptidoglycan/LPS O-acetylase OafA/YrhL|uniref:hypothetical protein n=1 Tax=Rhizobium ruizarguesonis TaxID=2081791 RepID=UPI0013DA087E|nr:hypothetical protein [Rhizobium ruizarguesonis]NEJ14173.1 hypothetical protein [Rhizobium ruizarguesonis]
MRIVREVALWISGILGFAFLATALAVFLGKIAVIPDQEITLPLVLAFALIFACIRLWILDRRSTQR